MGKLPFGDQDVGRRDKRVFLQSRIELPELFFGQRAEEGLQQDDGFAEASIDVVVRGIQQFPGALRLQGRKFV